jgi:hypothetical protein
MKFFNHDEKMAYKPTGCEYAYEIQEKVDGSIISLFWYEPPNSSGTSQTRRPVDCRIQIYFLQPAHGIRVEYTEYTVSVLGQRHPGVIAGQDKTYVFELVDNRMPIKIQYQYDSDLVLLSIIGNDGSETRLGNTGLPFRRPRIWKLEELIAGENGAAVTTSNLKQLSKLHRANEEGFVITFWRTKDDVYPQRVKVKLEDY